MKQAIFLALITIGFFGAVTSCKKVDKTPPTIQFVNLPGYTTANKTVGTNDTIKVGIRASKAVNELENFSVTRTYDNFTTYTTVYNRALGPTDKDSLRYDYLVITRSQNGKEKYIFTVSDNENNIASLPLTFTVN
jgi:hypothetical protein